MRRMNRAWSTESSRQTWSIKSPSSWAKNGISAVTWANTLPILSTRWIMTPPSATCSIPMTGFTAISTAIKMVRSKIYSLHKNSAAWTAEFFTLLFYSSYPFGLLDCHLQLSAHISLMPYCAVHPSSFFALLASA